ncbi:MAG: metallophosphoesterase [Clostridia bacterium]|nr:metallophosphoesterase [Clostridia bacterium]
MSIYAISDFHLSFGTLDKPMSVFGDKWNNHEEKLKKDWLSKITEDDTVILSGDFSWATYLEDTKADFAFLNALPGKKYMLKGNHDYWWTTVKKMDEFLHTNEFKDIHFLYNNAYEVGNYMLAGTRYWGYDEEAEDNEKIFEREIIRAKLSLDAVQAIRKDKPIIFTTHYPPDDRIIKELRDYPIQIWIYGHVHSKYEENLVQIPGIKTYLTSCDYLDFKAIKLD